MAIVNTRVARPTTSMLNRYAEIGVATIHEAQQRTGLLDSRIRPIYPGAHIAGSAITVSVAPGDNSSIHVAIEQCQEGDVVIVSPTSPSDAGYLGELMAVSLRSRGVRGVVIDAGCRDVQILREMEFPVWSKTISAFGTVKETLKDVNLPLVCAGQLVTPGDIVVADDDGVVIVPQNAAANVLDAAIARDNREAAARERYLVGELTLDVSGLRTKFEERGLVYRDGSPEDA